MTPVGPPPDMPDPAKIQVRPPQGAIFLGRASYGQRRLRDSARMLPIAGIILMLVPLLSESAFTARVGLFIFGAWLLLIVLSAIISYRMTDDVVDDVDQTGTDPAAD